MPKITSYISLYVATLIILLYLSIFNFYGYENSKFAADFLVLLTSSFVVASSFPATYYAIKRGGHSGPDRFIISYWLIFAFVLVQRIWVITITLAGRPEFWIYGPVPGIIATMIGIAGLYGMAAPLSGSVDLPRHEVIIMSLAAGISGVIAGMAIGVFWIAGWHYQ